MRAMPSTAVKAHNRSAMAQYLYGHSHVTKQELERELGLSLPTITQNLHALEDDGLIRKGELQDSTGGRKPMILSAAFCISIITAPSPLLLRNS